MANKLTCEEVDRIAEEFCKEYQDEEPFSEYVNGVFIAELSFECDGAPATCKEKDFYISVQLRKPLPDGLSLPSEYKGVRVIVEEEMGVSRPG